MLSMNVVISMMLTEILDVFVELLRKIKEDYGVSLHELQINHMLISSLVRTIDLEHKPYLFLSKLLLLTLGLSVLLQSTPLPLR